MRTALVLAAALLVLAPSPAGAGACDPPYELRSADPLLERRFEAALRARGLGASLDARRLTVSLVDLTWPGRLFYAGLHDDWMMYAASLPKIAILLALFEAIDRGDATWEDAWRWKIDQMINVSSNPMATWAGEQVGLRAIAEVMLDPRYCLYEPGEGGLWAGRFFQKGGPSLREPTKGLSHAATSRQVARFYVLLERGLLVSPYWSAYIAQRMSRPGYRHKFVHALGDRPGLRFLARKSGTWQTYHSDSALVQHGHLRYVLAALADDADGERMMWEVALAADEVIREGSHRRAMARAARPARRHEERR